MPPKKKEEVVTKPILGKFSSHLKMGIVGLPNVGKSSTFNLMTKCSIPAENFPFCTIDPNNARVNVPDARFNWLVDTYKPKSQVPAFLEVVDIAGLVKGASSGEGLGNAFLSHIKAVDGIFHVLRAFEDADIIHVEDRVDPVDDLTIINQELRTKDHEFLESRHEALKKMVNRGLDKQQKEEMAMLEKFIEYMAPLDKCIRHGEWSANEIDFLNTLQLITAKPVVYLVNLTKKDYMRKKNKWLPKIAAWIKENGGEPMIPYSVNLEQELFEMPEDEQAAWLKENETATMLDKIVNTGFKAIHLIYFFTAGQDEVKCWTLREGMKAPQAAGTIHTDFERGFICAEVMKYNELHELGDEKAVKEAGKYRQEGKNYVVNDADVIFFKFNVTAEKKK